MRCTMAYLLLTLSILNSNRRFASALSRALAGLVRSPVHSHGLSSRLRRRPCSRRPHAYTRRHELPPGAAARRAPLESRGLGEKPRRGTCCGRVFPTRREASLIVSAHRAGPFSPVSEESTSLPWHDRRHSLVPVKPDSVVGWYGTGFKLCWKRKSRDRVLYAFLVLHLKRRRATQFNITEVPSAALAS